MGIPVIVLQTNLDCYYACEVAMRTSRKRFEYLLTNDVKTALKALVRDEPQFVAFGLVEGSLEDTRAFYLRVHDANKSAWIKDLTTVSRLRLSRSKTHLNPQEMALRLHKEVMSFLPVRENFELVNQK